MGGDCSPHLLRMGETGAANGPWGDDDATLVPVRIAVRANTVAMPFALCVTWSGCLVERGHPTATDSAAARRAAQAGTGAAAWDCRLPPALSYSLCAHD